MGVYVYAGCGGRGKRKVNSGAAPTGILYYDRNLPELYLRSLTHFLDFCESVSYLYPEISIKL